MKAIYNYIIIVLAGLMMIPDLGMAQNISSNPQKKEVDGIVMSKKLTKENGNYWITLESYVTGNSVTTISTSSKPVDLILVLDMSTSMNDKIPSLSDTYTAQPSTDYSYNSYGSSTLYYLYNGVYYQVKRGRDTVSGKYRYYLYFTVNGTTYYLSETGLITNKNNARKEGNTTTLWTGVLYTKGATKTRLLQDACKQFIETVQLNCKDAADADKHRIALVKFNSGYTKSSSHLTEVAANDNSSNGTAVVNRLTTVTTSNATTLKNNVDAMKTQNWTHSDYGIHLAREILDDQKTNNAAEYNRRDKVVVLFTDGEPCDSDSYGNGRGNTLNYTIANNAVTDAYYIKNTLGAKVFSIGIFDSERNDVNAYMSLVSSRYTSTDDKITLTNALYNTDIDAKYAPQVQASMPEGETAYYQVSNGSDLTSIFNAIASGSTGDAGVYELGSTSATVVDIMTNNFVLPTGIATLNETTGKYEVNEDMCKVSVATCTAYDETTKKGTEWVTSGQEGYEFHGTIPTVNVNPETGTISLSGFDFSKDDIYNEPLHTEITQHGNWVGNRKIGSNPAYPKGNKLVIKFRVDLNPDYTGGFDMPSNDVKSGMYFDTDEDGVLDSYVAFEVPTEEFPSICIKKDGLQKNESAIFKVTEVNGGKTETYNVVLTQYATGNGVLAPCFVVLKNRNKGATVTVKETSWSWAYDKTTVGGNVTSEATHTLTNMTAPEAGYESAKDFIMAKDQKLISNGLEIGKYYTSSDGTTYCILCDSKGYYDAQPEEYGNSAVSVLFEFKNETVGNVPAHAEAVAHNVFKTGTGTSGSGESGEEGNDEQPGGSN